MKLTKEQKLLKAFVVNFIKKHDYEVDFTKDDWFKQVCAKPFVGNEDQDLLLACKEYLDQFVSVNEKVEPEPAWKPEVGKLYRRKLNGVITEVIKAFLDNREFSKVAHKLIGVNYDTCHAHCDYASDFLEEYEPIAELEGLKVGDFVYSYGDDGEVHIFANEGEFPFHNFITIKSTEGGYRINITLGGYFPIISNKQLFWRTADRAERFGRGDA